MPYGFNNNGCSLLYNGANCTVTCAAGFTASSIGTFVYRCNAGSLKAPDGTCEPNACTLPAAFGTGILGTCGSFVQGGSIPSGSSCGLQCDIASGYINKDPGSTLKYICVEGSISTAGSINCQPSGS